MDIGLLKDTLSGLKTKGIELGEKRDLFVKAQGLNESIEKTRQETGLLVIKQDKTKEQIKEKIALKNEAVSKTASALEEKMAEILPYGKAVFKIDEDGSVFIGWDDKPYSGLSGGEKVAFDGALCHALGSEFLIFEAAELDSENLPATMEMLSKISKQVIVNSCHEPKEVPDGWNVVKL